MVEECDPVKCPGCDLVLDGTDLNGQRRHMEEYHPEIVAERRADSARWDGWENDG